MDLKSFEKDGYVFGIEVRVRLIFIEFNIGLINVYVGVGVLIGVKIEGGIFVVKFVGSGFMVGKRIGGFVFDNEIFIDMVVFFGKGWLW